jgi:hypothetical protein
MKRLAFAGICVLGLTAAMATGIERKDKTKKAKAQKEQCCMKTENCCKQKCCR